MSGTITIRRFAQTLSVILVALLAFSTMSIDPADAATRKERRIERRLHNRSRANHGRRALRLVPRLNRIARKHSLRMANQDDLHHNSRLVRQVDDMRWRRLGENVGVAPAMGRGTLKAIHRAFLDSRPHRRNIMLRSFNRMGVGIVRASGKVWVTIVFMG
jgi:uncharacterized protein YkwD